MNMMFCLPAVVASSIVACRSFVSLANFQQSDVYVHSITAHPTTCQRPPGGGSSGGDATRGLPAGGFASDSSLAKTAGGAGNIIAGIAFRGMGTSVDSEPRIRSGRIECPKTDKRGRRYGLKVWIWLWRRQRKRRRRVACGDEGA